jgi:hypothetical protein
VAQTRHTGGEPEVDDDGDDGGDGDDEEVVVSAPQRKKRKTKRTTRSSQPQKPATPPRCTKTKRGALTSMISYEAAADLTGVTVETVHSPPTGAQNDTDVPISDEEVRPATDEGSRILIQNEG